MGGCGEVSRLRQPLASRVTHSQPPRFPAPSCSRCPSVYHTPLLLLRPWLFCSVHTPPALLNASQMLLPAEGTELTACTCFVRKRDSQQRSSNKINLSHQTKAFSLQSSESWERIKGSSLCNSMVLDASAGYHLEIISHNIEPHCRYTERI